MGGPIVSVRWVIGEFEFGTRRRLATVVIVLGLVSGLMLQASTARAAGDCPVGTTMNVVAHPDDDLLFQSPDLLHDIQSGHCVRTVYLTAGADIDHLETREFGVEAAYARMANAADSWTTSDAGVADHPMHLVTLTGNPKVSLVFMRLPEGIWGTQNDPQDVTLRNLWLGNVAEMPAVDESSSYTKQELISTLTTLMTAFQPDTIRAQDYVHAFDDGDHDDHHAGAYFAESADHGYTRSHSLISYLSYLSANKPQNVVGSDLTEKTNAFYAYLDWDSAPCGAPPDCGDNDYGQWLKRQYLANTDPGAGSTLPLTTFTSPSANQTVSGRINVVATAQDQSGTGMWLTAFRLDSPDGSPVNVDYSNPWGFSLDTTQLSDGPHTLYVRGADHAGHVGQDAAVTFTVDNSSGGTGGGPTGGGNPGPITSFANPLANQTVSGTIDVNATVQDQSGSGVWLSAFRLDSPDSSPVAVDYEPQWGFSLDTTHLSNGPHTLFVRAEDNVLNIGPDATVTFYVDNSGGAGG
jgi:LmbE family N-acetylglucosaminyl deacetylase